jgi:hypothetical protein
VANEWSRYVTAIRAAYPDGMPPHVARYVDTFQAESQAIRQERERAWAELDEATRWRLLDIHAQVDPQLFS